MSKVTHTRPTDTSDSTDLSNIFDVNMWSKLDTTHRKWLRISGIGLIVLLVYTSSRTCLFCVLVVFYRGSQYCRTKPARSRRGALVRGHESGQFGGGRPCFSRLQPLAASETVWRIAENGRTDLPHPATAGEKHKVSRIYAPTQ